MQVSEWYMSPQSTGFPVNRVIVTSVAGGSDISLYASPDDIQGPSGSRNIGSVSS